MPNSLPLEQAIKEVLTRDYVRWLSWTENQHLARHFFDPEVWKAATISDRARMIRDLATKN